MSALFFLLAIGLVMFLIVFAYFDNRKCKKKSQDIFDAFNQQIQQTFSRY